MLRRTPLVLALVLLLLAFSTAAPDRLAGLHPRAAEAQGAPPPIAKLVIFTPGIDATLSNPPSCPPANFAQGCFDPYVRVVNTFSSAGGNGPPAIMDTLGCAQTPLAGGPFAYCNNNIAWIPFSYLGVTNGVLNIYPGKATGQSLYTSANYMQQIVAFARSFPQAANAQIIVVAHSLGGSVASLWAGLNNSNVPVVTMDSPVNSIWTISTTDDFIYCNASVGLFLNDTSRATCNLFAFLPAASSQAFIDLHDQTVIATEAKANVLNFANIADNFVASWFAVSATPRIGAVLLNSACTLTTDPFKTYHECILTAAAGAVSAYISNGTIPPLTPIQRQITLNIAVTINGAPQEAQIQVERPGQVFVKTQTKNGQATVTLPWIDSFVTATYPGGTLQMGALPGADTNLMVPMAGGPAPSKSCTPASPAVNSTTICTVTMNSAVTANANLIDTVTGPSGATITNCGNTTGGLSCSGSGNPMAVTCSGGTGCAAGASFQLTLSSTNAGNITETLFNLPGSGGPTAQTWNLTPVPPAAFVSQSGMQVNGTATVNGTPATPGTVVNALIGTTVCGTGMTSGANGAFALLVAPATQTPGCGVKGSPVSFTIGGAAATPGTTFTAGTTVTVAINTGSMPPVLQPMQVVGKALYNGVHVAGAPVEALVGATVCGTATTVAGGSFTMSVNSASQVPGCGTNGATVTFTINGRPATPSTIFTSGGQAKVNISATGCPLVVTDRC